MPAFDPSLAYRAYIDCLNRQDWAVLGRYVGEAVQHNDRALGLSGYQAMLEDDFRAIPDLRFAIALLVADGSVLASRLHFDCTPCGMLFGLPVNGKRVQFSENVFYRYENQKIIEVWSVIDTEAIRLQLGSGAA